MFKWIVMFVCALGLTACGSMSPTSSSGYSGSNAASGSSDMTPSQPGVQRADGSFEPLGP